MWVKMQNETTNSWKKGEWMKQFCSYWVPNMELNKSFIHESLLEKVGKEVTGREEEKDGQYHK